MHLLRVKSFGRGRKDAVTTAAEAIDLEKEDPAAMTAARGSPRVRRERRAGDATRRDIGQETPNAHSETSQRDGRSGCRKGTAADAARLDAFRLEMPLDDSSLEVCREEKVEDAEEAGGRQATSQSLVTTRTRHVWWPSERRLEKRSR